MATLKKEIFSNEQPNFTLQESRKRRIKLKRSKRKKITMITSEINKIGKF